MFENWLTNGIRFPFAKDPETGLPSITLLFPYVTFVIALASVVTVHFRPDFLTGTLSSLGFWALSVIFYRLRKLDKLKFDIKTGDIEVDSADDKQEKDPNDSKA